MSRQSFEDLKLIQRKLLGSTKSPEHWSAGLDPAPSSPRLQSSLLHLLRGYFPKQATCNPTRDVDGLMEPTFHPLFSKGEMPVLRNWMAFTVTPWVCNDRRGQLSLHSNWRLERDFGEISVTRELCITTFIDVCVLFHNYDAEKLFHCTGI